MSQFEEVERVMEGFQGVHCSLIVEMGTRVQVASVVILFPRMDEKVIHSDSEMRGDAGGYVRSRSENFVRFADCLRGNCSMRLSSAFDLNLQANSVLTKGPHAAKRLRCIGILPAFRRDEEQVRFVLGRKGLADEVLGQHESQG